jgi:hypothetical protein
LAGWFTDAVDSFFPYQDGWEAAYDESFSPDVVATFNATKYDFDSFKQLYSAFYPVLNEDFQGTFEHGFISVIGVPNQNDIGGFVTAIGWEGGFDGKVNTTDAVFAVVSEVDGARKITEFRETSNLGSQ